MSTATEVRTMLVIDKGSTWDAARVLLADSTLRHHVTVTGETDWTVTIEHRADDVPFDLWGSGTQALWRLLSSMVYSSEQVSLYATFSRLDHANTLAAINALAALAQVSR